MEHNRAVKYYEDLTSSGMSEQQAKVQINMLDSVIENLATKDNLKTEINNLEVRLDSKLDSKLSVLESKLETKINELKFQFSAELRTLYKLGIASVVGITTLLLNSKLHWLS